MKAASTEHGLALGPSSNCNTETAWASDSSGLAAEYTPDSGRWAFRGRRVMAAVMEMLLSNEGLGDATDVLFIGDSTGGIATAHFIDHVHAQVGSQSPVLTPSQRAASQEDCRGRLPTERLNWALSSQNWAV